MTSRPYKDLSRHCKSNYNLFTKFIYKSPCLQAAQFTIHCQILEKLEKELLHSGLLQWNRALVTPRSCSLNKGLSGSLAPLLMAHFVSVHTNPDKSLSPFLKLTIEVLFSRG